jgi:hypothetical protein
MEHVASHPATDEHTVVIQSAPRTFPYRKTDYQVTVVDRSGSVLALSLVGSKVAARNLANLAWAKLREGVAPAQVWNDPAAPSCPGGEHELGTAAASCTPCYAYSD